MVTSKYLRLDKFVIEVLGDANPNDKQSIKKSVRRIHNKLSNGSIPRNLFSKFGRDLFVDVELFYEYMRDNR